MLILSPGGLQIRPNDHSAFFAYHAAIGTIQQIYKRGFLLCAAQFVARQCSNEFAIRKSALKMLILSPGGLQIRPNAHSAFFANHVAIGTHR